MSSGPTEFILIVFPGNRFNGEIMPALQELVDSDTISIVDLLFIKKDAQGNVESLELSSLDTRERGGMAGGVAPGEHVLSAEEIQLAAQDMPNNSSAGLLVWENRWAARFADAVRAANGRVVVNQRFRGSGAEAE